MDNDNITKFPQLTEEIPKQGVFDVNDDSHRDVVSGFIIPEVYDDEEKEFLEEIFALLLSHNENILESAGIERDSNDTLFYEFTLLMVTFKASLYKNSGLSHPFEYMLDVIKENTNYTLDDYLGLSGKED